LKAVNQAIYKEISKLGLLKAEKKVVNEINEDGSLVYDRFGKPKHKTVTCKNYRVCNEHKTSKAKTYFVEDRVLEEYFDTKKKKEEEMQNKS
jgi:hypothetical protein